MLSWKQKISKKISFHFFFQSIKYRNFPNFPHKFSCILVTILGTELKNIIENFFITKNYRINVCLFVVIIKTLHITVQLKPMHSKNTHTHTCYNIIQNYCKTFAPKIFHHKKRVRSKNCIELSCVYVYWNGKLIQENCKRVHWGNVKWNAYGTALINRIMDFDHQPARDTAKRYNI